MLVRVQKELYEGKEIWTVRATAASQILDCPPDLAEGLREETNISEEATLSLTPGVSKNYETGPAVSATLSALSSVLVRSMPRTLDGVYEVHNVGIIGISGPSVDDSSVYQMDACRNCKWKVNPETGKCINHPDEVVEARVLLNLDLADQSGTSRATIYHDAAAKHALFAGCAPVLSYSY